MQQMEKLVMLQCTVAMARAWMAMSSHKKTPGMPGVFLFSDGRGRRVKSPLPARHQGLSADAGTTPFGEWLSTRMICASRSRYGLPSACSRSWNQIVGGCRV